MIFITGANGWLGLNLVDAIVSGKTEKWGLKKDEIEYRVNFFSQFFKNKKFTVKELYPGVFSIE